MYARSARPKDGGRILRGERLHLREGDRLEFCVEADGSLKIYPITKTVEEVFGAFSLKARRARSASEINRDLRKAFETGKV